MSDPKLDRLLMMAINVATIMICFWGISRWLPKGHWVISGSLIAIATFAAWRFWHNLRTAAHS